MALTIILEGLAAYALALFVQRLWVQVSLAILAGVVAAMFPLLLHFLRPDVLPAGKAFVDMIGGVVWHPLFVLFFLYVLRKYVRARRRAAQEPARG